MGYKYCIVILAVELVVNINKEFFSLTQVTCVSVGVIYIKNMPEQVG